MAKNQRNRRRDAQAQDKTVLVELQNPLLSNAFGDPFRLQNFRFDEELILAIQTGKARVGTDDDDEEDEDIAVEVIDKGDTRIAPLVHANLSYAVEYFLRARDPRSRENLVVSSQADSDHIHDLGEVLQQVHKGILEAKAGKEPKTFSISKADHRWLLDKAKNLAYKAFPIDSRMFIDCLDVLRAPEKPEETEAPPE